MLEVQLIGNLGQDPEMRYTQEGESVTSFSVACDTGKDKTTWVKVSCWAKLAELANEHLAKGKKVFVRGRVRVSDYTDREGEKRYSLDVSADLLRFLSPAPKTEDGIAPDGQQHDEDAHGDVDRAKTEAVADPAVAG